MADFFHCAALPLKDRFLNLILNLRRVFIATLFQSCTKLSVHIRLVLFSAVLATDAMPMMHEDSF